MSENKAVGFPMTNRDQVALTKLRRHLGTEAKRPARDLPTIALSEVIARSGLTLIQILGGVQEADMKEQLCGISFIIGPPSGFFVECQTCASRWTIEIKDGHFSTLCPNGCNKKA